VRSLAVLGMTCILLTACLPDPQRIQSVRLLDQLVTARTAIATQDIEDPCGSVGDVESRLTGEPGLVDVKPAWQALHNAADALWAACGQSRLLAQPYEPSTAVLTARDRWQRGVATELAAACRELNAAADALSRPRSC
jgi:hypothetical protein